jgi:hypothetical protein
MRDSYQDELDRTKKVLRRHSLDQLYITKRTFTELCRIGPITPKLVAACRAVEDLICEKLGNLRNETA